MRNLVLPNNTPYSLFKVQLSLGGGKLIVRTPCEGTLTVLDLNGRRIMEWVNGNYAPAALIGSEPFRTRDFGIKILRRRE